MPPVRVLVVDDYRDGADATAMLLRHFGAEARAAYHGNAALTLAETFTPDLVLLDLAMPGMAGTEVAAALLQKPRLPKPMLVAVSGYGDRRARRLCAECGFDLQLLKPVDPQILHHLVLLHEAMRQRIVHGALLTAQHAAAAAQLLKARIEMAHSLLDVATTASNANTRQRCLTRAELMIEDVQDRIARVPHQADRFETALADLRAAVAASAVERTRRCAQTDPLTER
jgi:CheY-like chemotaxis protein